MKNENEIKAINKTMAIYRKAYKNEKIPRDVFKQQLADCMSILDTLKWVLGENDRYD